MHGRIWVRGQRDIYPGLESTCLLRSASLFRDYRCQFIGRTKTETTALDVDHNRVSPNLFDERRKGVSKLRQRQSVRQILRVYARKHDQSLSVLKGNED